MSLLRALANGARKGCVETVLNAITALKWTGDDFKFLNALEKIEQSTTTLPELDRALILQDTAEWRKHWDYYVSADRAALIALLRSWDKSPLAQHSSQRKMDWRCLRCIQQKAWNSM